MRGCRRWSGGWLAIIGTLALVLAGPVGAQEARWLVPATPPGGEAAVVGGPALAVAPSGSAALLFARAGDGAGVFAAVRPAGQVEWPAAEQLARECEACPTDDLSIATNAAGDLAAAWTARAGDGVRVYATRRPASATSWDIPRLLDPPSAGGPVGVGVGIDAAGAITVVWGDRVTFTAPGRGIRAARRSALGDWSAAAVISGPLGAGGPSLAVAADGSAVVGWQQRSCAIGVVRRSAAGEWGAPQELPSPGTTASCLSGDAAAALTTDGAAHVAWWGRDGQRSALRLMEAPAGGGSWRTVLAAAAPVVADGDPSSPVGLPALAAAGSRAALVWTGHDGVPVIAERDAAGWAPSRVLAGLAAPAGSGPAVPRGAVAGDGTSAVVVGGRVPRRWIGAVSGPGAAGASSFLAEGAAPFALGPPPGPSPSDSAAPALGVADGGHAVAAWRRGGILLVADHSTRPGAVPVPAETAPTGLRAPVRVGRGAAIPLVVALDRPAAGATAVIERRRGARWVRAGAAEVAGTDDVVLRLRATRVGVERLRVVLGGRPSSAVSVRVVRPARARIPVGMMPTALAAGAGAVWVPGARGDAAELRALDPRTGRPAPGGVTRLPSAGRSLAVGAGAVWVFGADGVVRRIDPRTRAVTEGAGFCPLARVVAGPEGVWVVGSCDAADPTGPLFSPRRVAQRLDPATGLAVGDPLRVPGAQADPGAMFGRTLWLWGEDLSDYDASIIARVDLRTGAVGEPVRFGGRFGVPLRPVGASQVWIVGGAVTVALPRAGTGPGAVVLAGDRRTARSVASDGRRAVVLETRLIGRGEATVAQRALRVVPLAGPRRNRPGAPIALGRTPAPESLSAVAPVAMGPTLVIAGGAAWVLSPGEGALLRVPLARS